VSTEKGMLPQTGRETEAVQEAPDAPQATTAEPADLGLALSGGGVRATLFSLGVVIALVETQCHKRVRCVTSVSGGSILNAALAHSQSLGAFPDIKEFEVLSSALAYSLASRGVFAFDWRRLPTYGWYLGSLILRAIIPLFVGLAILSDRLRKDLNFNPADFDFSQVPWKAVILIALATLLVTALLSRGLFQQAMYKSVLSAVAASSGVPVKAGLYVRDWGKAPEGGEPRVMHVLVATDLLSGEPMYFSSRFVHCRPYGWSPPEGIKTAEALYSSAAFPAVFPPKKLKLSRLNFQNGEMQGELPRVVRLVDGGVYNNLGTDWFDVLQENSRASQSSLWAFGELNVTAPTIEKKNLIVVNAGAPSRRVQKLGPFPFNVARIMSVLYDNTVHPRVKALRGEDLPLIDIAESPIQLAGRLGEEERNGGRRAEALALIERLNGRTPEFWDDFKSDTAGTKTKLSRAGRRTAARLMLHGYLSGLALLHVKFGAALPERIRGEEYFLSLVQRSGSAPT
jgi:predicted acylesterase/phospholipase RssA